MPAHPLWKTEQGMKSGGPDAFKYVKIHLLSLRSAVPRGILLISFLTLEKPGNALHALR